MIEELKRVIILKFSHSKRPHEKYYGENEMKKYIMLMSIMLSTLFFTTQANAEVIYIDEHELGHTLIELEEPITVTVEDVEVNIVAYEVVVTRLKMVELHVFYEFEDSPDALDQRVLETFINIEQDDEPASAVYSSLTARGDEYDAHRVSRASEPTFDGQKSYGNSYFYLSNPNSPVDIYHNESKFLKGIGSGEHLATWDFNESLDYNDEPDEPVEAPSGDNIIETNHVYLEILGAELDDDFLFVTYNVTPKTLYNTIGLVDYQYLRVSQSEDVGYSTVLSVSYDHENEDGETYVNYNTDYLVVGETVEVTKVMEVIDPDQPFVLRVQEIVSNEVYYEEELELED